MKFSLSILFAWLSAMASFLLFETNAAELSGCDCKSTSTDQPCKSNAIKVVVHASPVNGENSRDAEFEWHFKSGDSPVFCGQFANGDYWVAPKEGETVTLLSVSGNNQISLDINPDLEAIGLLDGSNNYGNYSSTENIISNLPMHFIDTVSLVAAAKRNEKVSGNCGTKQIIGECVDAYHVVTVLDAVPERFGLNLLRPNIVGDQKHLLSLDDFDLSKLPNLKYFNWSTASDLEEIRQRWSHSVEVFGLFVEIGDELTLFSEGGRAFRSHILIDDYAAGVAALWYKDMLKVFNKRNTFQRKLPAIASMLTYGHDLYHAIYADNEIRKKYFGSGAGQHLGKFMPVVMFASLSKNVNHKENIQLEKNFAGMEKGYGPQEIDQVNFGVNGPVWGDTTSERRYWSGLFAGNCYEDAPKKCNPKVGKKVSKDPYGLIDGPGTEPGSSYFKVSFGPIKSMVAIMHMWPEACRIIGYPSISEFVNRTIEKGIQTLPDNCAPPDPRENPDCSPWRFGKNCQFYGKTWGPDPASPGQCIHNSANQNGRFPKLHGIPVSYGYKVPAIDKIWDKIVRDMPMCEESQY